MYCIEAWGKDRELAKLCSGFRTGAREQPFERESALGQGAEIFARTNKKLCSDLCPCPRIGLGHLAWTGPYVSPYLVICYPRILLGGFVPCSQTRTITLVKEELLLKKTTVKKLWLLLWSFSLIFALALHFFCLVKIVRHLFLFILVNIISIALLN